MHEDDGSLAQNEEESVEKLRSLAHHEEPRNVPRHRIRIVVIVSAECPCSEVSLKNSESADSPSSPV